MEQSYTIKRVNIGRNNVSLSTAASQLIDGSSTKTLGTAYSWVTAVSDNVGWQIVGQGGTVS